MEMFVTVQRMWTVLCIRVFAHSQSLTCRSCMTSLSFLDETHASNDVFVVFHSHLEYS